MRRILKTVAILLVSAAAARGEDIAPLLKTLQAVGPQGQGHREAAEAWRRAVQADASQLPAVLAALDQAGPLAANWLGSAAGAIVERQLQRGGTLPVAELEAFLRDTRHVPRARRLAYEWVVRVDASMANRLLPSMLNDPGQELRRDAVAWQIGAAEALEKAEKKEAALAGYEKAIAAATDLDQIRLLAQRLRNLGRTVDVARQLGFIVRWKLIGPFDNTAEKGFDAVYPPEREIDLRATYDGKHGAVRWMDHVTADEQGLTDFNRALGAEKGVAGYAVSELLADRQREVEFRLASFNAVKLWLNGQLIDQRKVYHAGSQMDQYVSRAVLRAGRNLVLVKVCQNEQKQEWAGSWWFQLRVCDEHGKPVLSTDRQ